MLPPLSFLPPSNYPLWLPLVTQPESRVQAAHWGSGTAQPPGAQSSVEELGEGLVRAQSSPVRKESVCSTLQGLLRPKSKGQVVV